jgi:heme A synthase
VTPTDRAPLKAPADEPDTAADKSAAHESDHAAGAAGAEDVADKIKEEVSPLQIHTLLAGFLFALAAASLGLSYRSLAELRTAHAEEIDLADAQSSGGYQGIPEHDERIIDALRGDEAVVIHPPQTPPARFWLLTVLVGIPTALSGLCVAEALSWERVVEEFNGAPRDAAHIVLGGSIIVLALILAALTRWARRSGLLLSIFSLLLVVAVAGQIWMGVLLTFDSMHGPLTRFAPAEQAAVDKSNTP